MKLLPSFIAAAAFVLTAVIAVPATPASAAAVSCSGQVNPVNATNIKTARSMGLPTGEQLELRYGLVNGTQYAWTRLIGDRAGDKIWIDISGNSGATWLQCDLRTLDGGRNDGNALKTSSLAAVVMRAGARPLGAGQSSVTTWW